MTPCSNSRAAVEGYHSRNNSSAGEKREEVKPSGETTMLQQGISVNTPPKRKKLASEEVHSSVTMASNDEEGVTNNLLHLPNKHPQQQLSAEEISIGKYTPRFENSINNHSTHKQTEKINSEESLITHPFITNQSEEAQD